jgi:ubiquinone/menaquinone biosynthesis C-methylase UbiE
MAWTRSSYKWFYDNIHSRYYELLVRWCFLPFGGERRLREELIRSIDFAPGEKILDLCCGTGGATIHFADKTGTGGEVTGMDLSSGQVAIARKRHRLGNVRFVEGDAARTGFPDGYFDKVFITHALHEMPGNIRRSVLAEAKRVLRENGRLTVLDLGEVEGFFRKLFIGFWFFYWLPFNFEVPTIRDMLEQGLAHEVRRAGIRDVRQESKYHGVFQTVTGVK